MSKKFQKPVALILSALFILFLISTVATCSTAQIESSSNIQKSIAYQPKKYLTVTYIDVGQADSILIQTPNYKNILIDAGNHNDYGTIKKLLDKKEITTLDILVGTHPHEDHIGAMSEIVDHLNIKSIYLPKVTAYTDTFYNLLNSIKNKKLKVETPIAGSKINLDKDLDITILAPNSSFYEDTNNYSILKHSPCLKAGGSIVRRILT